MAQRFSLLFLSLFVGYSLNLRAEDYKRTVITDPSISRRCDLLTETRKEKIANKQRILAMIERNKHLQEITPENKVTLKKKLEVNLGHLEHELTLTLTQIQYQEENIVRKGCPGVTL
ncbi:hypothetical protein C0V70_06910 [Bacteriovorax stolpii]|uniref:Uncharacterized protein n=1 Tax=Bacteriovorax stolpii TaxID=960 RepID=A0A2K9NQR4_BACTC|nr:hypothetical protein [Bacteriovorax stolpii]AUN97843.1 hypothetical protein C0V70_06910 [Bacteriovorax stolpii]TDP51670.1 hypothetical protein C8D79_3114 [Bacteriovorax stolpii]BDT27929.1 hypothetical protein BHI3_13950 [Bacteriovorax sp. HI3]